MRGAEPPNGVPHVVEFNIPHFVGHCLLSSDGKKIATTNKDETQIWDAESGKELFKLEGGFPCFSPNGKRIATLDDDVGSTQIWDAESGKELLKLKGFCVEFFPDGKQIVMSHDGMIQFWDVESGKKLLEMEGFVSTFSPDRRKIVTRDGGWHDSIQVWDAESGEALLKLKGAFAGFSADGKKILTEDENTLWIWDAESGTEVQRFDDGKDGTRHLSPDGKKVAALTTPADVRDSVIRIWDAETGKKLFELKGGYEWWHDDIFSPDSKKIIAFHYRIEKLEDGLLRIWEAETGKELHKLAAGHWFFLPGGKTIATMVPDTRLVDEFNATLQNIATAILDVESGKELLKMRGVLQGFSSDGKKMVVMEVVGSAPEDVSCFVRIWDLTAMEKQE